ncbi:MAG: hypothetical protein K6C32_03835 [Bacilli bacterium]|nr:hypothetical protein [Bacilli bacterium]
MKKSRIIVPALAMIAFSTAASIAGSVAWFTANRTINFDAGTYAVVKTTANLECTVSSGVATTVNESTNAVTFNGKLTDGSFDHLDGMIYAPTGDGTAIASTGVAVASASTSNLLRGQTSDSTPVSIYTAATFELSFKVKFGAAAGNYGLYLDNTASHTNFSVSGSGEASTAKGFRMGFYGSTRKTVLADLQTAANCKYVDDTSDYDGTAYVPATNYDLMDSSFNNALPTSESTYAQCTQRSDYLGTFTYVANGEATLTFTVVCWYEGTDPEIDDDATVFQSVGASLHFAAVKIPNAS